MKRLVLTRVTIGSSDLPKAFEGMKVKERSGECRLGDSVLVEHLNVAGDAQREGDFSRADEILRQIFDKHVLDDLPVEILYPLTRRTALVLENHVATVGQLVQQTLPDVCAWYNFGDVSRSLLGERMRAFGLNLTGAHDYAWITPRRRSRPPTDCLLLLPTFVHKEKTA